MLRITIPAIKDAWDEDKNEFICLKKQDLQLEHSLVSLSKWESKWCKPFIGTKDKTTEEMVDYIRCMTINPNIDPDVYNRLTIQNVKQIEEYISAPMTATRLPVDKTGTHGGDPLTSEILYYCMIAYNIPMECQKWHLNRLITLIRVCDAKNRPQKKMSKREIMNRNSALNASRRNKLKSKG